MMNADQAIEEAEQILFPNTPAFGEYGWRPYTEKERKKLSMLANSIYARATGRTLHQRNDI